MNRKDRFGKFKGSSFFPYKYIHFENTCIENGKPMYCIKNNKSNELLGYVFYDKQWNQYIFTQAKENIIFSVSCLKDIIEFIEIVIPLNEQHFKALDDKKLC